MSLVSISDLFDFEKGSLQSSKNTPGEFDFITASSEWKNHNEFTHNCEALIFAAAASGSLGRTHYVNGKFISSDLCFIITPKNENKYPIDLKFYHIIFNTFKEDIVKNTKAGTSKEAIGLKSFGNYKLPYFDINVQKEIRKKINLLKKDTFTIDFELTNQLNLIKQLRQSFLREAMQGKLVSNKTKDGKTGAELLAEIQAEKEKLIKEKKIKKSKPLPPISKEEIPFEIPENWVWCRLGETGELKRGKSKHRPRNDENLFMNGIHPFIQTGDVAKSKNTGYVIYTVNGYYNDFGLAQSQIQKEGTLCITIAANIAECGFLGFDACTPDSIVNYISIYKVIEKFVFYYLIDAKDEIEKYAPATAQKNINLGILNDLKIPFPSLHEQEQIVSKLDELMQFCDHLENSVKESQKLNEQLLQQVLREALQPKDKEVVLPLVAEDREEYSKTKVVELKPTNVDYYKRSVLAAELVWQLHKEPTLGHLKLQKLIYLCQKTSEMQLPTNFLRQAMGPYDNRLMRSIDKQFLEKKWFSYNKQSSLKYLPLEKAGEHQKDFLNYFSNEQENIQFLIDKFRKAKSDSIEIVATLYACIERILEEKSIFSEGLLIKYFYEWSDEKKKFSEIEVKEKFAKMIKTGIIPKGFM